MTSVVKRTIGFDFSADPILAPQNKINPAQLQSTLVDLYALLGSLIDAAAIPIRDDNALVDALVRNRNLHAEVSTILGITAGWQPRAAVACASTGNLVLTGEQTIDGVTTLLSRVLVKDQTAPAENGIYLTGAGAWARATDVDTAAELARSTTYVAGGTTNRGSAWVVSQAAADIVLLGTTAITWAQFGAEGTTYAAGGWQPKAAVACATTGNIALTGEQTLDGVLTAGSRVLVKSQTAPAQNGIYVSAAGAWSRAADCDTSTELGYAFVYISGGSTLGGSAWVVTAAGSAITLGTTAVTWVQTSPPLQATGVVALVDAATIATNCALGTTFDVTLGGNRTLGVPTNPVDGMKCVWRVKQDGGGPRTLAFNAIFRFSGAGGITSITLTTTAGKTDYIGAQYNAAAVKWDILAFEPSH